MRLLSMILVVRRAGPFGADHAGTDRIGGGADLLVQGALGRRFLPDEDLPAGTAFGRLRVGDLDVELHPGGQAIGATDALGLYAIEDKMHVSDIHASILWLLGLDNMQLTYDHKGRPERPTINEGSFNPKLVGAA